MFCGILFVGAVLTAGVVVVSLVLYGEVLLFFVDKISGLIKNLGIGLMRGRRGISTKQGPETLVQTQHPLIS